jgi:hypothetical protein
MASLIFGGRNSRDNKIHDRCLYCRGNKKGLIDTFLTASVFGKLARHVRQIKFAPISGIGVKNVSCSLRYAVVAVKTFPSRAQISCVT